MKEEIENFFTNSAKVLLIPDTLFKEKIDAGDHEGVLSLLFYICILGLVIGIGTKSAIATIILIIVSIICVLIFKLIHCGLTYLFSLIFKGEGKFFELFNLMCYEYVSDVILIVGIGIFIATNKFLILLPILALVGLWKVIITTSAVNTVYKFGYGKSFVSAYGILLLICILVGLLL